VIQARRRAAKGEMREKISRMRRTLESSLRDQFRLEMERSASRIAEAVAPYSRFVRGEHEALIETRTTLERLNERLSVLRDKIGDASPVAHH
jgi:BMFP domain-containing protein YqiC